MANLDIDRIALSLFAGLVYSLSGLLVIICRHQIRWQTGLIGRKDDPYLGKTGRAVAFAFGVFSIGFGIFTAVRGFFA